MKSLIIRPIDILLLWTIIFLAGCRPYHDTLVDALIEFPSYITEANKHSFQLLAEEHIGGGTVLLYAYESVVPDSFGRTCIATTFIIQKENRGWQSQSASQLGCRSDFLQTTEFEAAATVGGNVTELAVAYGLTPTGSDVRVSWNDGLVETTPVQNGVFIAARPKTVLATKIELLDSDGTILQTIIP